MGKFIFWIVFLIGLGYLIDYLQKDKYVIKKKYFRKGRGIGSGQEFYYEYWFWQPNKKKVLKEQLYRMGVAGVYQGRSGNRKGFLSIIKREVYGVIS